MIEEQKGTSVAESLLEDLGFDSLPIFPAEIVRTIDDDDFRVVMEYKKFSTDQILGKAEGNNDGALIYINQNISDSGRLRFTEAHEVGHVCLHIMERTKMYFECGYKELSNPFDDPVEKEANGFAAGLLLPQRLIRVLTDGEVTWRNIRIVSSECEASLEATYRRMSILNKSPTAFIIHKDSKFQRFVSSPNFGFYIERSPLSSGQKALCVDVKDQDYPNDFDTVDASEWVNPDTKGLTLSKIYSSSIILSNGFVYSIICYDDDCFEEDGDELSIDKLKF